MTKKHLKERNKKNIKSKKELRDGANNREPKLEKWGATTKRVEEGEDQTLTVKPSYAIVDMKLSYTD